MCPMLDLWIVDKSGIVVFSKVSDPRTRTQLLGALLTALSSFAREIVDRGLQSFELKNARFTITARDKFLFVIKSPSGIKEQKIKEMLKAISSLFIEEYEEILGTWNGDTGHFSDFDTRLEKSLPKRVSRFWKTSE